MRTRYGRDGNVEKKAFYKNLSEENAPDFNRQF